MMRFLCQFVECLRSRCVRIVACAVPSCSARSFLWMNRLRWRAYVDELAMLCLQGIVRLQVSARSVTKGQRQQLRDVLEGSQSDAAAVGSAARSANSGRLQDMQPAVLSNGRASGGAPDAQAAEDRRRVTARDFSAAPSATASGIQQAARSPLGDGPVRGSAHHRATSKISSVMSAMPWHRNKEGGDGAGGGNEP